MAAVRQRRWPGFLSEVEIPDQVELPGEISVKEMREYLDQLIRRLRRAAAPEL